MKLATGGGTVRRSSPAGLSRKAFDRVEDGVEVVEQRPYLGEQLLACHRWRHATRRAVEQPHAKPALEFPDGFTQPRAGDAQLNGCGGKAAPLRDGHESVHLRQFRSAH
jgi:hypothetical protein